MSYKIVFVIMGKKILKIAAELFVIANLIFFTAYGWYREQQVLKITREMPFEEVVAILGEPTPDVENSESIRTEFDHCGKPRNHFWFSANPAIPGLLYGHLEDTLLVAVVNGKVCDFQRIGL